MTMAIVKAVAGPSAAELAFIERGKAAFAELFPGQRFENDSWDLRLLKKTGDGSGNSELHFTRLETGGRIVERFANIAKAYLAISGKALGTMVLDVLGCRWLWEACRERRAGEEHAFTWQGFRKDDAERAEELMIASGLNASTVYRRCKNIRGLLKAIAIAGIIAPMEPVFRTPRTDSLDRLTLAGQEARMDKLPSEEAIHALARLFNDESDLTPFERLLMCVVAIMFASGLRISETLQLQTNALRKEGEKFFLCYFKSKSKRREEKMALSRKQAELVEEVIRRALELTGASRKRAAELVASPYVFPLPNIDDEKLEFSTVEVDALLNMRPKSSQKLPLEVLRRRVPNSHRVMFDRITLQKYLQAQRERYAFETIRGVTLRADGTWLPIDQALFIAFRYANHGWKGMNPLLVELLSQEQVGDFLGSSEGRPASIFERLNLTEKGGKPINLNAHQIRHYVTAKSAGAGISDAHLMRWQRREHAGDLEAYKHLTIEERVTRLREHVKSGRLKGEVATMYFQLAANERDVFLENVVQAIHVTHLGFCVHDFNAAPCPKALNCVKGCGSYLHDTADKQQRNSLLKLKVVNSHALNDAKRAMKESQGVLVKEWVADLKATNDGIDQILATVPSDGTTVVAPFDGKPSRFEPLE